MFPEDCVSAQADYIRRPAYDSGPSRGHVCADCIMRATIAGVQLRNVLLATSAWGNFGGKEESTYEGILVSA